MSQDFPTSHWVCPCGGILVEEAESGSGRSDSTGDYFTYLHNCSKCGAKWLLEIILQFGHKESSWRKLTNG